MATLLPGPELKISSLEKLSSIRESLQIEPQNAGSIKSIIVLDDEELDEQLEGEERMALAYESLTWIINAVTAQGGLEAFSWTGSDLCEPSPPRPRSFWDALAGAAATLKSLELGFYVHEIHELGKTDIFPTPFPHLESLKLDLSGGHGDDATQIDSMLRKVHNVRRLTLDLPTCDLENCRIKGLSYDYHLMLDTLTLSVYDSPNSGLLEFLARHSVKTLSLNLDGDGPTMLSNSTFPDLRALKVNTIGNNHFHSLLSARPIVYLSAGAWSKDSYGDIPKAAATLTCLETEDSFDAWRESEFPQQLREILAQLPHLREFALYLPTQNVSWTNEDGTRGHPQPMGCDDLRKLLSCFPTNSKVEAVRMKDERGLAFPSDLTNLPVPDNLEYIRWEIEDESLLYQLHRDGGTMKASLCGPSRAINEWTDESILNHFV